MLQIERRSKMSVLDKLEKKFGRFTIKNLMLYIVIANAVVYIFDYIFAKNIMSELVLNPSLVLKGQVWRLITFIFIPPVAHPIFILFVLYFYYIIGSSIESEWGSFRFNLYYFIGVIAAIAAAFIGSAITGFNVIVSSFYLNLSLFLAFAYMYPNYEILLFFILPVKMKYIGYIEIAYLIYWFILGTFSTRIMILAAILNFLLFFGKSIILYFKNGRKVHYNRKEFYSGIPKNLTIHKCVICGITEKDDPKMDFRYCVDCEGDYEYCAVHLENHQHVKKDGNK